jgi:hypothetical protein
MSEEEFDRMVALIAEVELYGEVASPPAVRLRANRPSPMTAKRGGGRAA